MTDALLTPAALAMTTGPIDAFYNAASAAIDGAYDGVSGGLVTLWEFFIVLTIVWTGLRWALSENPVAFQGMRRLLFLSVLLFAANRWVPISGAVAAGFAELGVRAAGPDAAGYDLTQVRRPSSFGTHSFTTAFGVIDKAGALASSWKSTLANLPTIALLLVAGVTIFACGAAVVILMLTYLLLFKVGCVVVFCLLPFAAFDKTAWVAERPMGWVVSSGVRFLVISLVVGLLYRFARQATAQTLDAAGGSWDDLGRATSVSLQLMLVNLLLLVFVGLANRFAGEIAGGAATLTLSDFSSRAASGGAVAAGLASAAAGPIRSAGSATYGARGTAGDLLALAVVGPPFAAYKGYQAVAGWARGDGATTPTASTHAEPGSAIALAGQSAADRLRPGGSRFVASRVIDPSPSTPLRPPTRAALPG